MGESTESIWQAGCRLPKFQELDSDRRTDVLIIGGGMAGLLTAYYLHQAGVNYILVEKERICSGTTHNTTAKITFQHGLIYQKIAKYYGIEAARKYLSANKAAFERFEALSRDIDCDFLYRDNYVYSLNDRNKLEREIRILREIGYSAELCDKLPLPFETAGAVKFADQAQFHPLKFVSGIAEGLHIYENTHVRELIGKTAVTAKARIQAKKIIIATHFPFLNKHGLYFLKLYQHRSYMLALETAQNIGGMYVDENHKGMTFRNYGDYLILGGGGHRTGKKTSAWAELRHFVKSNYPGARTKYVWAAQDCMSLDGMPYVGQYSPNTPDLYTAGGFNKWGMTGAMLSAMILCDLICGKRNEYQNLLNPSRNILKPQLFLNGFEAIYHLLQISEKRCPHLGCALKWNAAEHSWDCACHGSRFAEDGTLLNNPANGNLAVKETF